MCLSLKVLSLHYHLYNSRSVGNENYMACSKLGKEQDCLADLGLHFQRLTDMNSVWEHSSYSRV